MRVRGFPREESNVTRPFIRIGPTSFAVGGVPAGILARVLSAVASDAQLSADGALGLMAELIAVELRASGFLDVVVDLMPGFVLRHSCGQRWTVPEWRRAVVRQACPALFNMDDGSWIEAVNCSRCGSTIGMGSCAIVADDQ